MEVKELVEFVNNVKKDYKFGTEYLNKKGIKIDNYDKLFDLLAIAVVRCVKFEKMVIEYKEYLDKLPTGSDSLKFYKLLNRYFPKKDIKKC